ncbi:hypothetical protein BGZ95_011288 [Linnemannia exigua]|uniref:Coth-domain-containing protein n=1 Tax=Linnemannia exigua TaxID=604196 RepID=A0AAD4DA42_9FUNG|nr:hypothetical protein BGZ95_011288 [Linnemannia exigua]
MAHDHCHFFAIIYIYTNAHKFTFNVIGYPSAPKNTFGVSIDGAITQLVADETTFPVWKGIVPTATSSVSYQYVELNAAGTAVKTESFSRTLPNVDSTSSYNEFFERPTTKFAVPSIPYTYLATWPSYTKIFNDDEIATIHVIADAAQMAILNANPTASSKDKPDIRVTFRWIDHNEIYTQHNISFMNSGKSSMEHRKQSWRFDFDTDYKQNFFSRPHIKLRSGASDPTMLRERTYIDLLNSAGIPTQQWQYVRLFVNSQPYGLFLMVDDIRKSFIKQTIHGGDPSIVRGSMVQMNAPGGNIEADLIYRGPTSANYREGYDMINIGNNPITNPFQQLIAFMKDLQDFNPATTPNPIAYWNDTRLDLDGFLRCMALEYLTGAFDNYWRSGSNYFMYFNPTLGAQGKWQWIPTDFDGTLGNGYSGSTLLSYQTWTLKELVQTVFKPEALFPRIMAHNQMLSLDYHWDVSINRTGPGKFNGFTFDDFNNNLVNTTSHMSYSIKGWITDMSNLVSTQLKFEIPAGVQNRVDPPPKPTKGSGKKGGDVGDDGGDDGNASKNGAATGRSVAGGAVAAAAVVGVASLVSFLL